MCSSACKRVCAQRTVRPPVHAAIGKAGEAKGGKRTCTVYLVPATASKTLRPRLKAIVCGENLTKREFKRRERG